MTTPKTNAEQLVDEDWKPVTGYEGFYEVSDCGGVRSLDRKVNAPHGVRSARGRVLAQSPDADGYHLVALSMGGNVTTQKVHHLVLNSFCGPCPDGMECRHKDGIKNHNHISNLDWNTRERNCTDRQLHGAGNKGERHNMAKLTEVDVMSIREHIEGGGSCRDIGRMFSVSAATISNIGTGKTWGHLKGK